MDEKTISVIGRDESEDLDRKWGSRRRDVKAIELKEKIQEFMSDMQEIIDGLPEREDKFHLDTIEIHAEVSAKGTISLLGTGGELGGGAGIKFVLKRSP